MRARREAGRLAEVEVSGHAGYKEKGTDIVCAGISAITLGAANALVSLLDVDAVSEIGQGGYIVFRMPRDLPARVEERAALILEGMLVALKALEESYPEYLRVEDPDVSRGIFKP
ncbi:MAG: ribosomal-processing cysteine protease Prp [Brockia lithotrophica]|nr:ribosomal-processing cysteine protease Prp [Brockia lithotrophica]